jgi:hypothetical protein
MKPTTTPSALSTGLDPCLLTSNTYVELSEIKLTALPAMTMIYLLLRRGLTVRNSINMRPRGIREGRLRASTFTMKTEFK